MHALHAFGQVVGRNHPARAIGLAEEAALHAQRLQLQQFLDLVSGHGNAATPRVEFYRDIAPIVYSNCSPCHRPGESASFPLLSYDDVKRRAAQIAAVTKRRYMPPWLPEPGHGEFAEERRLTDQQIDLIQR